MPTITQTKHRAGIKESMRVILEIQLKNDANGMENKVSLTSVVEELLEDGNILIHMPIYQGYHYPLPRDGSFFMMFFEDDEMYALPVQFIERVERDGFMFARIRRHGRIRPYQRRDCYRLPCSEPVSVERLWINERELYPERKPVEGQIINFSDGGMSFNTDENIEKDEKLTFTFDMGKPETVEGMALRTERIENGKYMFRVAVRFRNRDKAQKRRFYQYIVQKQLEERRRWMQALQPLYVPVMVNEEDNKGDD